MTEAAKKAEEKPKCYFGIIPKEELPAFFERFKKALAEGKKLGDKKSFELELRGSKEDPKGVAIEIFTFDKTKYAQYFDNNIEYIKKSLDMGTITFEVKEEKDVETIKEAFKKLKPMIMELPGVKDKPGKYEFYFRNNGTKCYLDVATLEGKIIKPLLDLGISFSDFHDFAFALKTAADIGKLYDAGNDVPDDLLMELFNLLISIKSSGTDFIYITKALNAALKDVKLNNEKLQKKLDKIRAFLDFSTTFVSGTIKFEYDCGVFKKGKTDEKKLPEDFKKQLSGNLEQAKTVGTSVLKPTVEQFGFLDALKALKVDNISIVAGFPKYENGYAITLNLPGLTHVLEELLK